MSEKQCDKRGEGEPIFLNVGKTHELCRFPATGQWSLRLKLADDDVSHQRYLNEHEVAMVEAALAYTPSHALQNNAEAQAPVSARTGAASNTATSGCASAPHTAPLNCDPDAQRWAREFIESNPNAFRAEIDEGTMIGWFANAIMCGQDTMRWKMEKESAPSTTPRIHADTLSEIQFGLALLANEDGANLGKPEWLTSVKKWAHDMQVALEETALSATPCIDDLPLRCEAAGGVLDMRIGEKVLAFATENCPDLWDAEKDLGRYRVTDAAVFAKAVARELNRESEGGSTPLSRLLDEVVEEAINQGAEGVEENNSPDGGTQT